MRDVFIRPEEIASELAKAYPERVRRLPKPVAPFYTFSNENLYGCLVYVVGEGIKGQYLRHEYFYREFEKWWGIRLGWVTLYGRLREEKGGGLVPLVVLGVPTRYIFSLRIDDFEEYLLEEVATAYIEVRESHMVNLERCMQGRDPVLIIDKHGILRQGKVPGEFIDKIVEQQKIIEQLQKALWEYEKNVHELEASNEILRAENAKLRELVMGMKGWTARLVDEVTWLQGELLRLKAELRQRERHVAATEEAEKSLISILDSMTELIENFKEHVSVLHSHYATIAKSREQAEKARGGGK